MALASFVVATVHLLATLSAERFLSHPPIRPYVLILDCLEGICRPRSEEKSEGNIFYYYKWVGVGVIQCQWWPWLIQYARLNECTTQHPCTTSSRSKFPLDALSERASLEGRWIWVQRIWRPSRNHLACITLFSRLSPTRHYPLVRLPYQGLEAVWEVVVYLPHFGDGLRLP